MKWRRIWASATSAICLLIGHTATAQTMAQTRCFEAIAFSPTEIRLYWLPAQEATGYRITRDGKTIAQLPATANEYRDTEVLPNTLATYTLQAMQGEKPLPPLLRYVERSFAPFPNRREPSSLTADVVVMQASSSGVAAAYEAAKRGVRVILCEPTMRLGGMPVNGLCASDIRRDENGSGFFQRFRKRVTEVYAQEGVVSNGRAYEPRVSHQAMKSLLYEVPNLTILRRTRLAQVKTRPSEKDPQRRVVTSVVVEELGESGEPTGNKAELRARFFIDATDCGDLAAWAGAPFRLGREPRSPDEPHNGVIYYDRKERKPLPGSTGEGDARIQSYSYLLLVKDYGESADKTLPLPKGYRKEDFDDPTLPDWKSTWAFYSGAMPNKKHELNQHPKGGDLQEINYRYATGNYRERKRVEELYRQRVLQYLYYIQTTYGMKRMGLPDDEFRENGGFPPLLYVREGRRILGEQLPLEREITEARKIVRPESVGIGDYPMDSHAVRKKTDNDTRHMGEGEWWLFHLTPWYEIPFGILVPQKLDNVLVTTAVSSTHVTFGTYRMEPVRMGMGQAGGVAAVLALRHDMIGREIPVRLLQEAMLPSFSNPHGDPNLKLYQFPDLTAQNPNYRAIQMMATRGFLPNGTPFAPNAPTTRRELTAWVLRLAGRADLKQGGDKFTKAVSEMQRLPELDRPATRGEIASWLARLLPETPSRTADINLYADISDAETRQAAARLARFGITSAIWDASASYAPEGKLYFRPNAPLNHSELFFVLYLIDKIYTPLMADSPADFQNGREP